jgi:hypothetical protein
MKIINRNGKVKVTQSVLETDRVLEVSSTNNGGTMYLTEFNGFKDSIEKLDMSEQDAKELIEELHLEEDKQHKENPYYITSSFNLVWVLD